ncbi:hypothetical protein O9G_004608 [Rozella allomycis CSF55]|uniref:Uncharacterized protein n=1 Tax=Rozella allomycis (strain CSF55) TaxID=988480 RepID=A0A075AZ72_ROZAC|nr:hypothetical protein O9G_004608 [Rozella allomycis CSF55]|eukprot:EPZ34012.1 hypothetical protein O9G_004608 [Rozella allomycis CSF55]
MVASVYTSGAIILIRTGFAIYDSIASYGMLDDNGYCTMYADPISGTVCAILSIQFKHQRGDAIFRK